MGGRGRNSERYYLHWGKQGKHIPGHNNYGEGKSIITVSKEHLIELFNVFRGTGEFHGNKEVVDFGEIIGVYIDGETGEAIETTRGTIHYKNDGGWHIVPAQPWQKGENNVK